MSWQRCEKLLSMTLLFIHKGETFIPVDCPSFLEAAFPAYFISAVPEDFTMAYIESSLPSSQFNLFDESYGAIKIFLNYTLQVLGQTPYPTPLISTLFDLLSTCPRIHETELFMTVLDSFKSWFSETSDLVHSAKLLILLSKIPLSASPPVQKSIFQMLSSLLEQNDLSFKEKGLNLLSADLLTEICAVIVESLASVQELPKQPQNVNVAGFGKDKYEEEDLMTEEFCSFNRTRTNYEMQHWYYCYTCKLVANRGTCSVCARKCHKGHEVVYSRRANFFCDCGANQGNNSCKSMPKGVRRKNINARLLDREDIEYGIGTSLEIRDLLDKESYFTDGPRSLLIPSNALPGSMINFDEYSPELHEMPEFSISSPPLDPHSDDDQSRSEDKKDFDEIEDDVDDDDKEELMIDMDIEDSESELKPSSKSSVEVKKPKSELQVQPRSITLDSSTFTALLELSKTTLLNLGDIREPWASIFNKKSIETSRSLSKHLCNFKSFSSIKSSYSEHKELKDIASRFPGSRSSLAYCPELNLILMAEGNKLISVDSSLFQTTSTEIDRSNIQYLCKHVFSFHILSVNKNPDNSRLLVVAGANTLSVVLLCSKQHRGYIEKKITISIACNENNKKIINKVRWMPRSQTLLAVCTNEDLRIFDLTKDIEMPLQVFKSLENDLTDMVVDRNIFLVSSSKGQLFREVYAVYNETRYLQETVSFNSYFENGFKITSMEWLDLHRLLFVNMPGKILIIRPDSQMQSAIRELFIDLTVDSALSSQVCGFSNIIPVPSEDSLVCVGISRKVSASPVLLKITESKVIIHSLKKSVGYADGICLYTHHNKNILLVQNDDGSLVTHSIFKEEDVQLTNLDIETINSWLQPSYLPRAVKMSVTFFEKCIALNGMRVWGGPPGVKQYEVVLSGDPVHVFGSSKLALEKLTHDRNNESPGLVSSMLSDPKTVTLTVSLEGNSANSLLLAGFKVYMETGSGSYIELLNRKVTSILAQKRWYDVPLCEIEILKVYLQKQITIKIHTPNPARHPIRLYSFEIFAINQSGYNLEQKLSELARIQSGSANIQAVPAFYKHQPWKNRFALLESQACKPLVVFINALACSSLQMCDDLVDIVARVALQVFSSKVNVGIVALRQSLKALLVSMGAGEVYLGAKALVMCWSLANTSAPSEECCRTALKTLCELSSSSCSMFSYVVRCYPDTLRLLNEHMMPSQKLKVIEKFLTFIFAVSELRVNDYSMDVFLDLLCSHNSAFKEQVISKTFALIKKINTFNCTPGKPAFVPDDNIVSQLNQIFNVKDSQESKGHSLNLLKTLLEALCKDWSGELCKVNSILSLLHKLMIYMEKVFLRGELDETEFFSIITTALHREIHKANTSALSQGRLFFLQFCNLLISYSRPKEEKYSKVRKMHKSVVLAFVDCFDSEILTTVLQKLQLLVWKFKNGEGSQWAVYNNEFLVEVGEMDSLARLAEPEDPLLISEWEGVIDSEVFEQPNDQFFVSNLVDFAFNLLTVVDGDEMTEIEFQVSDEWKNLLIEMILEPSLQFVRSTCESLLEILCDGPSDFLCTVNQAKIIYHFSIIKKASDRNNYFKNFRYNESLFLLKELKSIHECIRNSEDSWKLISSQLIQNYEFIQTFIKIALNLSDQASEECLRIVNNLLSSQDQSSQLEQSVNVIWEQFFESVVPILMSKLTLTGNPELSKQSADLLNNLSCKSSERVCRKIEELMLHYFENLPNLGSNSYHFIMNFMAIASNSIYSQDLKEKFCKGVIKGLENSSRQLSTNIDNETYEELQRLFSKYGFHWYLLEREPCLKCFDTNYTSLEQVKIQDLQSEMRFSDNSYFVRFKNPIKVSKISIKISEIRGYKAVIGVSLYFCNTNNKELADLKHNNEVWALIKTVKVKPASTNNLDIDLDIPTIMLNLKVKFQTVAVIRLLQEDFTHFYQPRYVAPRGRYSLLSGKKFDGKGNVVGISIGNDKELMTCPRCSKTVEDRYGLCTCGENANQCFKCRNINYESLEAFLCNECGEGRYSKVDIFVKYTLDAICESVSCEGEALELVKEVDGHLGVIQGYYENLPKYRENLKSFIAKFKGESSKKELKEESGKDLNPVLYSLINTVREYQDLYYSMMISVKSVALLRTAIVNYSSFNSSNATSQDLLTSCYGCNFSFMSNLLKGLISLNNPTLINILITRYSIIETIIHYIIHSYSQKLKKKGKKLIIHLTLLDNKAIERLYSVVNSHIATVIQYQSYFESSILEEIHLVLDFTCEYFSQKLDLSDPLSQSIWNLVLQEFWKIFFIILDKSWEDSKVSNTLALFLDMILDMIFKTLILYPGSVPEAVDVETANLFINNPALFKSVESPSNSSALFMRSLASASLLTLYDDWQAGRVQFETWQAQSSDCGPGPQKVPQNWIVDCLLYSSSVRVQDMSRMIIRCLAGSGLWEDCLYLMLERLPEALAICHQGADYYFTVLAKLLEDFKENHEFVLEVLLSETAKTVQDILAQQEKARTRGTFIVNISLGHGLACLLHMLTDLSKTWARHLLNNQKLANLIINSFLNVRKIQFVKNKVISESQEYLERLFDQLHMDCSEDQRLNFLQECVKALIESKDDLLAQVFLVQQIVRVVEPTKPEPLYYMRLEKSLTQEEFIRGNIERNPYSSIEIGALMADVRKRICKDLELSDPDLLELLVANQIISPSLKINQVYESVYWPHVRNSNTKFMNKQLSDFAAEDLPQMMVTFRLAGLDGEATEDIVDSLPGDEMNQVDPEIKYNITKILGSGVYGASPVKYLLDLVSSSSSQELTESILTLLYYSCRIYTNRAVLCQVGGVPVLLKLLNSSQKSMQQVLKILEILIADHKCQPYISGNSDSISLIMHLLQSHKELLMEISPILPFLCQGNAEACSLIVNYFTSNINVGDLVNSSLPGSYPHIEKMLESLQSTHSTLKDFFLSSGITRSICDTFLSISPSVRPEETKFLLKILKGLVSSHYTSQQLLSPPILEKIFKMKNDPNGIGPCAECLIESVLQDREKANPAVADLLQIMTFNEDGQRREKALKKKQEILKQFQIVPSFDMNLEEEEGLTCVICKEGYKLRPDDLLGFYIYVTSTSQATFSGDLIHVVSLVTHFNAIHLQCHKEAARAEKSMRKPKTEWEGATIRNQHTKCNNWFPIWGPQIPKHDYASGVQWMFNSYSSVDSRFINEVFNLKLILEKFAYEESFSKESRGGGPEHNMQAIPYLIQMIMFLMEEEKEQVEFFANELKDVAHKCQSLKPGLALLFITGQAIMSNWNDWKAGKGELIRKVWTVSKAFPKNEAKVQCLSKGAECSADMKLALSAFKGFLVVIRIVDLIFSVLLAGNSDLMSNRMFFQSASEEIQERSLFIYEDYRKVVALQSVQEIFNHLGIEFNVSFFS